MYIKSKYKDYQGKLDPEVTKIVKQRIEEISSNWNRIQIQDDSMDMRESNDVSARYMYMYDEYDIRIG